MFFGLNSRESERVFEIGDVSGILLNCLNKIGLRNGNKVYAVSLKKVFFLIIGLAWPHQTHQFWVSQPFFCFFKFIVWLISFGFGGVAPCPVAVFK